MKVAALYVEPGGIYYDLPDVDPWSLPRDAREYAGPHPVVAHPPCSRWCRLAGLIEARWGYKRGEDDGYFESALTAVRRWGGVLEHPAYSNAWPAFNLNRPPSTGGWANADFCSGWTCHVEQGRYGHPAKKATWLYACKIDLPSLKWGVTTDQKSKALVSWCCNHVASGEVRPRLGKKVASATPIEFRDALLGIAKSYNGARMTTTERSSDVLAAHCQCGKSYTLAQWELLQPCGIIEDDVDGIELRHCVCGSTISVAMEPIELVEKNE